MRHRRPAQRHRLLLLRRRRIPQSQGQRHEAGRQPLLPAEKLVLRIGNCGHRLPLRRPARGHHGGGDHYLWLQAQGVHHQGPRHFHCPLSSLLGELCSVRHFAGDGGEHEQRAALRQGVDGRRLLRREERRLRRSGRAGRRHGAFHPRPDVRDEVDDDSIVVAVGNYLYNDTSPRGKRGHGAAGLPAKAMRPRRTQKEWDRATVEEGVDSSGRKGQAAWDLCIGCQSNGNESGQVKLKIHH